jgi:hypothetical protein
MSHDFHSVTITTPEGPAVFRVRVTGQAVAICGVRVNGVGQVGRDAAELGELYAAEIRAELARMALPRWMR